MWGGFFRNKGLWLSLIVVVMPLEVWAGSFDKGVLWQVNKTGQQHSYILGTIHSDDPSVTNLPYQVQTAFDSSTSFTAELDLNLSSMLQAQMQMLLPEDKSLRKIIGDQRYRQCVALMSGYGIPEMMVDRMKPWAVAAQLNMPKSNTGLFLDLKLHQMAQLSGKQVYGLETVEEQMGVFDNLTQREQKLMLDQAIKDYPEMPGKISRLIQFYLNRDLRGMLIFSEAEMKRADPAISDIMENKLINERNRRMVMRMQPQLKAGKAFIAVGALHLPGKQGVLQLLKDQGYRLKAVY